MDRPVANPKPRLFYGYIIVLTGFFVLLLQSGMLYSYGVFLKPLGDDFGWSRALTSGAHSLFLFLLAVLFVVTGRLTDRYGPRRVLSVCGAILGVGFLLMSRINNVWQLYLVYGVIVAVGQSGGVVPMLSTVSRWFRRRRGLMTGILVAGVGVGQVIVPPVATHLITNYGWRTCYAIVGGVTLVVIVSLAQLLKRDPSVISQFPDGDSEAQAKILAARASEGFTREEALRTRAFWMLWAMYFCYGFFLHATMVHIVPHATDLGISALSAAAILSIIGGMSSVGRISMGSVGDRIGNRPTVMTGFILAIVALLWLQIAGTLWMFYTFAVVFGFAYGTLIVLESPMAADLFGVKALGAILGVLHFAPTVAGAISPFLAGKIYDMVGSYEIAFLIFTAFSVAGLILILLLKRPQGRKL